MQKLLDQKSLTFHEIYKQDLEEEEAANLPVSGI